MTTTPELAAMYESGLSLGVIARRVGVSEPTVRQRLLGAGVTMRARKPPCLDEGQRERLLGMKGTCTLAVAARSFGVSPATVGRVWNARWAR